MLQTQISGFIEEHKEEMVSTLQALLRIPSVLEDPLPDQPFGHGPAMALEYMLNLARERGLIARNVDGYAGYVEYGIGDDYVAVLSHLDVVPAGSDWTYPPFAAEIHDNQIFARGAIDDKGPAISTLWALLALKQLGLQPKRKIRLVFGLDEESDWRCVQHYFRTEPAPLGGFTPDADFPLIYAEKGLATMRLEFSPDVDCMSMSPTVIRFEGGQRVNMVPDYAYAVVDCHSETAASEWEQSLYREARQRQIDIDVSVNGSRLQIVVHGVSAHGSTPDRGVNAVVLLAALLGTQSIANASMWRFIGSQDTFGRALGIEAEDNVTGSLTANLGRAFLTDDTYAFLFDIRYPIDLQADQLLTKAVEYVSDKWQVSIESKMEPLFVPIDSPVVQVLSKVYEEHTGDTIAPIAIGGATYARACPNAVAFGALFPGQSELAHQKDESWSLDDYFRCIQIYAHAMFELANTL